MTGYFENELGSVQISEAIVRKAVRPEIEKPPHLDFANRGRKRETDLSLRFEDGKVVIELAIAVALDTPIYREAIKLQGKVKRAVEAATGIEVSAVNVHILRVFLPEEKQKPSGQATRKSSKS